jgi:hypothetical protein
MTVPNGERTGFHRVQEAAKASRPWWQAIFNTVAATALIGLSGGLWTGYNAHANEHDQMDEHIAEQKIANAQQAEFNEAQLEINKSVTDMTRRDERLAAKRAERDLIRACQEAKIEAGDDPMECL